MNEITNIEAGTDLIALGALTAVVVFAEGGVRTILDGIKAEVATVEVDISTPGGRKACASLAYKIARSKTALDKMGKDLTDQWRRQAEVVHAERRTIIKELDELADSVRRPLTDWENAEKARVARHEAALAAIIEVDGYGAAETSAEISARLDHLRAYPARDWQEFRQRAERVLLTEVARTQGLLEAAQQREAEAREQERLRIEAEERRRAEEKRLQEEREARIAAEAAEHARLEAERKAAESARIAAEAADASRKEAERKVAEAARADQEARDRAHTAEVARLKKAADDAETARVAESRRIAAEEAARKAETARVAAEQQRREIEDRRRAVDRKHRGEVMGAAKVALMEHAGVEEEAAKRVVLAIACGHVPAVKLVF